MNELLQKVLISIATSITLASLSLLFESVRNALLYFRVQYDFEYEKDWGHCEWDINWEDYRLTFSADEVSNDRVDGVSFRRNKKQTEKLDVMFPSDKFQPLFDKEIYAKINSIIRQSHQKGTLYTLRLVLRRRRF